MAVLGALAGACGVRMDMDIAAWKTCQDERYGFALRYPPEWHSTTEAGRCVQIQKGQSTVPEGVPEVDIFLRVMPLQGSFPADYLQDREYPVQEGMADRRGVTYGD